MRVRIKFTKQGCMKYIGHLDVMRYFQKAIRRADLPVVYSGGFSPHMLMSFAAPLGVGQTSMGEYFDLDLRDDCSLTSADMTGLLNRQMVEGVTVVSVRQIPADKASKGMSLVAAAGYTVRFRDPAPLSEKLGEALADFLAQSEIRILRKTKRSEKETDIRPWIHRLNRLEDGAFSMLLSAGSVQNLKPQLVMEALASYAGIDIGRELLLVEREDIYADPSGEGNFVSLDDLGEEIHAERQAE